MAKSVRNREIFAKFGVQIMLKAYNDGNPRSSTTVAAADVRFAAANCKNRPAKMGVVFVHDAIPAGMAFWQRSGKSGWRTTRITSFAVYQFILQRIG